MGAFQTMDGYLFYLINQSMHCRPLDKFFPIYTHIAATSSTVILILAAFLLDEAFGRQLLFAVLFCQLLVQTGKRLIRRVRPFAAKDMARVWEKFALLDSSFPSGHTATAFTVAVVASSFWGYGFVAYPLAVLVGISRIYLGVHYPSDVFIGALVGFFSAMVFVF